ncbi:Pvc16 family protein [Amycolatopsis sp. cmx-4-61]|uniref:Pvc16 family protein n=1 Tax=Amycolatopsis sp. cmx-4-61 TaxID=2790937 RepID=UPI00397B435C
MLHHIDALLGSVVRGCLPREVGVRFDAPAKNWPEDLALPVVDLFPYRIAEDIEGRAAAWSDEIDERGRIVARVLPARRYRVAYLLTVWADDTVEEHRLIGHALRGIARVGVPDRPAGDVDEFLDRESPITMDVANPGLPSVPLDVWTALGIAPRAHLDIVVTATLAREVLAPLAAPPSEVALGASARGVPVPPPAQGVPEPPRRRIKE